MEREREREREGEGRRGRGRRGKGWKQVRLNRRNKNSRFKWISGKERESQRSERWGERWSDGDGERWRMRESVMDSSYNTRTGVVRGGSVVREQWRGLSMTEHWLVLTL